jgi:hypothetical protein
VCTINYQAVVNTKTQSPETASDEKEKEEEVKPPLLSFVNPFASRKVSADNKADITETPISENAEFSITSSNENPSDGENFDMTSKRTTIFRRPLDDSQNDDNLPPNRHYVKTAASEDGILHGLQKYRGNANFPFLSATKLLPSYNQQENQDLQGEFLGDNSRSHNINGKDDLIRFCRTWAQEQSWEYEKNEGDKNVVDRWRAEANCSKPLHCDNSEENNPEQDLNLPLEWTSDGPPSHWATQEILAQFSAIPKIRGNPETSGNDNEESPVHFASQTFSTVSRALHQHVLAHFQPVVNALKISKSDQKIAYNEDEDKNAQMDLSKKVSAGSETPSETEVEGLLEEKMDESTRKKRLGIATVAGGVAGGIAGLMFAGPVGWVIGGKMGQTAGMLGFVLEGSVSIGVFASGVAAGRHAGQQLQDKIEENRVLALGDGTKRRILLVRPSVTVDAEWADIYTETRRSHRPDGDLSFNIFSSEVKAAKRERYEREFDIVKTDEDELATADKVLLLVSRILNNRESLPGHVYRRLLEILRQRAEDRGPLHKIFQASSRILEEVSEDATAETEVETNTDQDSRNVQDLLFQARRSRRQDAHAIIKYITATLLEIRPGFSASPIITELTATAVESLVFGEVYDLIIEEIEADYGKQDNALLEKIAEFERRSLSGEGMSNYTAYVSLEASEALSRLPEAHSVADKLRYCTYFLERISDFFSESCLHNSEAMGADSLLKLVCQHIISSKVFGVNAQIAFLEEFARDEQLLRGKEGYSLVTLQASLHFLNASEDFETDIFNQEDD